MSLPDSKRIEEIKEIIDILGIQDDQKLLRHVPLQDDDPDGKLFELFHAFVQLVAMISGADFDQKCDILKDIILLNKKFNVKLDALDYYTNLCKG